MSKPVNPLLPEQSHGEAMCSIEVGYGRRGGGEHNGRFGTHSVFDEIPGDALGAHALKTEQTFWRSEGEGMATAAACPRGAEDRLPLSGTELCKALSAGAGIPKRFSHLRVLEILPACNGSLGDGEKVEVKLAGQSARRDFGAAALRGVI